MFSTMNLIVMVLLLLISCTSLPSPTNIARNPTLENEPVHSSTLQIIAIDVGQGDATLVIGPAGETLLIDGGPPEVGSEVVFNLLNEKEVASLDWIVASHYDLDHLGGLPEILEKFSPEAGLWDRGEATTQDHPLFNLYRDLAAPYRQEATVGDSISLGDEVEATVIVVNGNYTDGRKIHLNPDEENEGSIGLLIRYGSFKYFTAGDLTGGGAPGGYESKDLETIAGEIIGDIDILHVGHHGSLTSTNEDFLNLVKPETAIISVGPNDYGHPNQTVLERLEKRGIEVWRTDQQGDIEIESNGVGYLLSCQTTSQQRPCRDTQE